MAGAIDQISGYERQKYITAVAVMQSQDPGGAVQLIPADNAPTMAALVENPASPEDSRETTPRYENPRTQDEKQSRETTPRYEIIRPLEDTTLTNSKSEETVKLTIPDNSIYATPDPSREIKLKSTPSSGSEGSRKSDGDEKKKRTTPSG